MSKNKLKIKFRKNPESDSSDDSGRGLSASSGQVEMVLDELKTVKGQLNKLDCKVVKNKEIADENKKQVGVILEELTSIKTEVANNNKLLELIHQQLKNAEINHTDLSSSTVSIAHLNQTDQTDASTDDYADESLYEVEDEIATNEEMANASIHVPTEDVPTEDEIEGDYISIEELNISETKTLQTFRRSRRISERNNFSDYKEDTSILDPPITSSPKKKRKVVNASLDANRRRSSRLSKGSDTKTSVRNKTNKTSATKKTNTRAPSVHNSLHQKVKFALEEDPYFDQQVIKVMAHIEENDYFKKALPLVDDADVTEFFKTTNIYSKDYIKHIAILNKHVMFCISRDKIENKSVYSAVPKILTNTQYMLQHSFGKREGYTGGPVSQKPTLPDGFRSYLLHFGRIYFSDPEEKLKYKENLRKNCHPRRPVSLSKAVSSTSNTHPESTSPFPPPRTRASTSRTRASTPATEDKADFFKTINLSPKKEQKNKTVPTEETKDDKKKKKNTNNDPARNIAEHLITKYMKNKKDKKKK